MDFINALKNENNFTKTENGATALKSTLNSCLDMFGSFGAMKDSSEEQIINVFKSAFLENREAAMRMLFYFRNIRGGQGIRRPFRICIKWLAEYYPEYIINNLENVFEFGRCDDVLCLLDTDIKNDVLKFINEKLTEDISNYKSGKSISLLAKWLPSLNASSKETIRYATIISNALNMSPRKYRKTLSALRSYSNVIEVKMSANNWSDINYNDVPGKAALNYANAFYTHDCDRYIDYLKSDNSSFNANALYPVDIVHKMLVGMPTAVGKVIADSMWKSLPNYFEGNNETGLCVVDVSGSMNGVPVEVAISLGIYCADKCNGPFKNHFITFSANPELVEIKGNTIFDKVLSVERSNWGYNTDIEKVFDLILNTAISNNCKQEDIPNKLYIISDMQFDSATRISTNQSKSIMQQIKDRFNEAGYTMPAIVYWNVRASECGMFQDTFGGQNVCMVSGYSPSLFKAVLDGTAYETEIVEETDDYGNTVTKTVVNQKLDPLTIMNNTICNERYDCIWVG